MKHEDNNNKDVCVCVCVSVTRSITAHVAIFVHKKLFLRNFANIEQYLEFRTPEKRFTYINFNEV